MEKIEILNMHDITTEKYMLSHQETWDGLQLRWSEMIQQITKEAVKSSY